MGVSMNSFIVLNTSEGPPVLIPMKGNGDYATGEMPSLDKQITVTGIHFESPSITITTSIDPPITCLAEEIGTWRLWQAGNLWEFEYRTDTQFGTRTRHADPVRWRVDPKNVTRMG